MAAAAAPATGQALSSVAGAAAGGPATSGSDGKQDSTSQFGTGNKTVNFGMPPPKASNPAFANPYLIGGALLATALVLMVWIKNKNK